MDPSTLLLSTTVSVMVDVEEKWKNKNKRKKEGEVQKELVEKVQREDRKPLDGEYERGKERKGMQKERQTS